MVLAGLIALLVWVGLQVGVTVVYALVGKTKVLRWGLADLWLLIPYAGFIWLGIWLLQSGVWR